MNGSKAPMAGRGRLQWNGSNWFGASLGGSAWMLVMASFLALHGQPNLAAVPAGAFAVVLLVALALWSRRDRTEPFGALMALLGALAVAGPLVWLVVQNFGSPATLAAMNWPETRWPLSVVAFALVPVLMLWFWYQDRAGTAAAADRQGDSAAGR